MVDGQSRSGNAYHKGRNETFFTPNMHYGQSFLCPAGNSSLLAPEF